MPSYPLEKSFEISGRTFTPAEVARFESGTVTAGGGIILVGSNATGGRGTSFRNSAGTNFQVGSGVTLKVMAVEFHSAGQAANFAIAYSDAAVAFDTAGPGTNPVYYGGGTAVTFVGSNATAQYKGQAYIRFDVPTAKFPFMYSSASVSTIKIYCFID